MIDAICILFTIPSFIATVAVTGTFLTCCAIARVNPFSD